MLYLYYKRPFIIGIHEGLGGYFVRQIIKKSGA